MEKISSPVFIDTSAFIALYVNDDEFHERALDILNTLRGKDAVFTTSNFVLDEMYTFLRARKGKKYAIEFAEFLAENVEIIKTVRISIADEKEGFRLFKQLDGRGVSFTDCTSFALMKRLGINHVFTFDDDFSTAGFKVLGFVTK